MDIDFAILADAAEVSNDKVYLLGGGWTVIWAREVPAAHRGALALGIRVAWDETNQQHSLGIEVRTTDGDLVQEIVKGEFEAGRPPGIKAGSDQLVKLAAAVNFKLERFGEYEVIFEINGEPLKRLPFLVGRIGPGGKLIP